MLSPLGLGLLGLGSGMIALIVVLIIWSAIWKGIALWKSGRNKQLAWYVVMFILNTAGILEIVYLLFFQKKSKK